MRPMLNLTMSSALAIVVVTMFIGDIISTCSKGRIPQMLVVAVIFLIGYWTIFPKDILDIAGITTLANIMMSFILIHVGTMFNIKDILNEWKVVVTTLAAVAGIVFVILIFGTLLFGKETAFTAAAPMTGGGMAALIMKDAATTAGLPELGMLAMMIFIMHGFFGFPLTATFLGKESQRLLNVFRQNNHDQSETPAQKTGDTVENTDEYNNSHRPFYEKVPERFRTPTYYLALLTILGFVCSKITEITGINNAIVQVLVGIVLSYVGLVEPKLMDKTASSGILNLALFASFMSSFAMATWEVLIALLIKIVVLMVLALIAIFISTYFFGKLFGYSPQMAFVIGLNCFLGFPFNFALTTEAIKGATDDPAEVNYLTAYLMPKMIIAGIVSVSLVSAILAGLFAGIAFT